LRENSRGDSCGGEKDEDRDEDWANVEHRTSNIERPTSNVEQGTEEGGGMREET
jgi:hypothetical protein